MAHYELRPFGPVEAVAVASWAASPEDRQELGGAAYALTADDVTLWTLEANWSFTLFQDGLPVAYGEIIEDEVEGDVELQHLLVAPSLRRAGVGRALVSRLCTFLAASRPYREVWLRAGRQNAAMQCCACAAGFVEVADMSGPRFLWLKKSLAES
jgi:GNAT superfamily N-acetyltransferase